MPARNRSREAAKATQGPPRKTSNTANKAKKNAKKKRRSRAQASAHERAPKLDPSAAANAEVRHIMPADATKTYLCPGCNRDIPPGLGHMVAVPPDEPDLRRHWHRGCWNNRHRRF